MSARSQQQTAAVLADKKRQRREARMREHYDRISAALSITDSTKFAARHPTRIIPDVPGIMELSKTEVKRDTKDIERHSEFRYYPPMDDEDTLLQAITTSAHPPALDGSHIITKMQRLLAWQSNPTLRDQELELWRKKMQDAGDNYRKFESEQQEWYNAFEACRKIFTTLLTASQDQNALLADECARWYRLCEEECVRASHNEDSAAGTTHSATTANKSDQDTADPTLHADKPSKMKISIRDMVEELSRLQTEYANARREEVKLANNTAKHTASNGKTNTIVVHVSEKEMDDANKSSSIKLFSSATAATHGSNNVAGGKLGMISVKKENTTTSANASAAAASDHPDLDLDLDLGDADAVYHDIRNLQILLQQGKESIERCEMQESDVDVFFQEREDQLTLVEQVLLQRATGIPIDKRNAALANHSHNNNSNQQFESDKLLAEQTFADLCQAGSKKQLSWEHLVSDTLDAMEPAGLVTRNRKKKAIDHLQLNVSVRHRTERGQLLMYTPLSQFEDRYFAIFPDHCDTIYTSRLPTSSNTQSVQQKPFVNTRDLYVPAELVQVEEEALSRAYLQSDAAALALHIKQLQASVSDIAKLQQEADAAFQKAQVAHRHLHLEEHAEYVTSMVNFAEQGLVSAEFLASLNTPETTLAMAHLESMQKHHHHHHHSGGGGIAAMLAVANSNSNAQQNIIHDHQTQNNSAANGDYYQQQNNHSSIMHTGGGGGGGMLSMNSSSIMGGQQKITGHGNGNGNGKQSGGKPKKGGFGAQRQSSHNNNNNNNNNHHNSANTNGGMLMGIGMGSSSSSSLYNGGHAGNGMSAFSALAALTAVTEGVMFNNNNATNTTNTNTNTANNTSHTSTQMSQNNSSANLVVAAQQEAAETSMNNTTNSSSSSTNAGAANAKINGRRTSRGGNNNATTTTNTANSTVSEEVAPATTAVAVAVAATTAVEAPVAARGGKGRKSLTTTSQAESAENTTTTTNNITAAAAIGGKGGRRSSANSSSNNNLAAEESNEAEQPITTATTAATASAGNKRKSEAMANDAVEESHHNNTSSSGSGGNSNNSSAAAGPAAKRQRVIKK